MTLVASLRALLVQLGVAMSAAGDSVDAIDSTLRTIVAAFGVEHVEVAVLPTSLMVSTGHGTGTQIEIGIPQGKRLRFDQVAELYSVVRAASSRVDLTQRGDPEGATRSTGCRDVPLAGAHVGPRRAHGGPRPAAPANPRCHRRRLHARLAGRAVETAAPGDARAVFPVVVSFSVSVIVFATLQQVQIDNPVRILIPPLATFLPGGALTIATVELAAGQMVSGASRLVNGLVQLMLLSFGILAASALFELPAEVLADNPVNRLGWWAPWVGVVVFAVGNYLHFSSPARSCHGFWSSCLRPTPARWPGPRCSAGC